MPSNKCHGINDKCPAILAYARHFGHLSMPLGINAQNACHLPWHFQGILGRHLLLPNPSYTVAVTQRRYIPRQCFWIEEKNTRELTDLQFNAFHHLHIVLLCVVFGEILENVSGTVHIAAVALKIIAFSLSLAHLLGLSRIFQGQFYY